MKCPKCGRRMRRGGRVAGYPTYSCSHGAAATKAKRAPKRRRKRKGGKVSKAEFLRRMRLGRLRAARRRKR